MHNDLKQTAGGVVALLMLSACGGSSSTPETENNAINNSELGLLAPGVTQQVPYTVSFADEQLQEASGLQRSQLLNNLYYAHNDSGDGPVVYVTNVSGQGLGTVTITDTEAVDWEAIAGAKLNGVPHIIVADIGNNSGARRDQSLLVIPEPALGDLSVGFTIESNSRRVALSYADGNSYDAEAVFIDGDNDTVVVIAKNGQDTTAQGIWKGSLASGIENSSIVMEYRGLVALSSSPGVNAITDIDIHPNGREIAVLTYGPSLTGQVHIWAAQEGEGTADSLTRAADTVLSVPVNSFNTQAEGISYSADGAHVLVAAEGPAVSKLTVISR